MRRASSVVQSADSSTQRANSHRSSRSGSRCSKSLIRQTRARVRAQPLLAVQQVLQPVVGGITDLGLRVDHQPRLPHRPRPPRRPRSSARSRSRGGSGGRGRSASRVGIAIQLRRGSSSPAVDQGLPHRRSGATAGAGVSVLPQLDRLLLLAVGCTGLSSGVALPLAMVLHKSDAAPHMKKVRAFPTPENERTPGPYGEQPAGAPRPPQPPGRGCPPCRQQLSHRVGQRPWAPLMPLGHSVPAGVLRSSTSRR